MGWSRVVAVAKLEGQLKFSQRPTVILGGSCSYRGVPTMEVSLCSGKIPFFPLFIFHCDFSFFFLHYLLKMINCNFSPLF